MIKVSIFSFTIFGDFNELLVNSVLLAAYRNAGINYFPRFHMQEIITCRIQKRGKYLLSAFLYAASKLRRKKCKISNVKQFYSSQN